MPVFAFFNSSKSKKSPAIAVALGLAKEIPPSPETAVAEGYLIRNEKGEEEVI